MNYGDGQTQGYTFDAMGNRLTKTDSATGNEGYWYDDANRLVSRRANGTTGAYTSDANGNTLTGGGRTSTWDSQNRMATCAYQGNNCSYVYGADRIRHQATVNGTTTNYVLDNSMFIREQRGGSNYATYLFGPRGPEYRRDDTTGAIRWYVYDGLGSVAAEVDPSGNVTAKRKYDVYGLVRSGDAGTSAHKFVGALGHPSEADTGLVYMQARYMDPALGRFTSQDPTHRGANWFAYCSNDPVNGRDADGHGGPIDEAALLELVLSSAYTLQCNPAFRGFLADYLDGLARDLRRTAALDLEEGAVWEAQAQKKLRQIMVASTAEPVDMVLVELLRGQYIEATGYAGACAADAATSAFTAEFYQALAELVRDMN